MQTSHKLAILAAAALIFILAGCTLSYRGTPITDAQNANDTINGSDITVPKYGDPNAPLGSDNSLICKELPGAYPCTCMFCQNKTPWQRYAGLFSLWYDESLKGGDCNFTLCNATIYFEAVNGSYGDWLPRTYMYSVGPSFKSTANASQYCSYSLQLATKWMRGNGAPPVAPAPSRGMCWLENNVIPLFLYYTNGTAISPSRTEEIALGFQKAETNWLGRKGAGPVMITTEVDFNSSDPAAVDNVKQQILALDKCEKCITVLAIKTNDTSGLSKILGAPGAFDPTYYPKVDVIGFGFRANDYKTCNLNAIIAENFGFARTILKGYYKPTIILYAGASEGNSSDGSCQWSPEMVSNFYDNMFALTQAFASSGIIGTSFYEYIDGTGPLPCNGVQGCSFGLLNSSTSQKHPALNTWSDLCNYYSRSQDYRSPIVFSRNGYGSVCDVMPRNDLYAHIADRINSAEGLNYSNVAPYPKVKHLGCGEVCVDDAGIHQGDIYDKISSQVLSSGSGNPCTQYPEIDERADDADISAVYMRAVVSVESSFDPWVVSCNPTYCGTPRGTDMSKICTDAGYGPDCPAHTLYTINGDKKHCPSDLPYFCAYGLSQCIEYPGSSESIVSNCKSNGKYNPFNPSDNICCGINKMRANLDTANKWINDHWATLSQCPGGMKEEEKGEAAYYFASLMYYGAPYRGQLQGFVSQRDDPSPCDGIQHYISYLQTLHCDNDPNCFSYSKKVMSRYVNGVGKCGSDCPGLV